jgi:Rrf2 family transcriptional regulator, iron-sulfur cluster assembly transcription factor
MANLAASYQGKPRPIKKIAADEEISPEFLEQIFFKLKKQGIIGSVRGPGGGFVLEQSPSDISIKDIFLAVDEGLDLTPCTVCGDSSGGAHCVREEQCLVYSVWKEASEHIIDYFSNISLQDVLDQNKEKVQRFLAGGDISA